MPTKNPYQLDSAFIKEAPTTFRQRLKFLGPGFILSASIVGSGELIATTTLGAKAGFITFWIILVSCVIKVALQLEFGKHTILYGETAMMAFNKLPGPKFRDASWSIWALLGMMIIKFSQLGGIIGGVALTLNIAFPQISIPVGAFLAAIGASLLVYKGYYKWVERISILMIGLFTILTFTSLYFLRFTEFEITGANIISGLTLQLPPEAIIIAIGAFGITGVGGDEIIHYTYWCLEKGYATFTGPFEDTEAWRNRAKGWIKVMELDAIVAMIVYTVVTAAFYLLGAAILHQRGDIPQGYEMIETLSNIYTQSLGEGAKMVFLIGALVVLFSTLFSGLAAWSRQYTDIFGQIGLIDFMDTKQRNRSIAIIAWVFPLLWAILFLYIKQPVLMVIFGGIITSIILFLVIFAAIHFRYYQLRPAFKPTRLYDLSLWLSIMVIGLLGIYGLIGLL